MWRKMVSRNRTVRMRSKVRVSWNKALLPDTLSCPVISRGSASIETKSVHRPQGKPRPCGRSTRTQPKFPVRSVKIPGSTCVESHVISSPSSLSSPRPAPYARSLGAGARHVPTFSWLSGHGGEAHRHATFCGSYGAETSGFFNHAV